MPDVLKTVGRYEILREVGRGGMAMVYLARQTDLDRFVALKELAAFHASDAAFAQRFLRESRVAGSLSHPNIVTVHDYFEHAGTPYIAMEYVERGSLRPFVGQMTLAQIGGVLEGLLAGLAQAEQHGIVHRDLKPENLMVTSDGRVKIADFGIAKATKQMQTGAFLTATGTTVGTPTYMAPEQAMAQDIGPWTDLYSVGCMAFEMFTGRVPFHDSDAPMAILLRHVNEEIAPVKSIDPVDRPGHLRLGRADAGQGPEGAHAVRQRRLGRVRGADHRAARAALAPVRAAVGARRAGRHAQAAHAGAVRGRGARGRARRTSSRASPGASRWRRRRRAAPPRRPARRRRRRPTRRPARSSPARSTSRPARRRRRRSSPWPSRGSSRSARRRPRSRRRPSRAAPPSPRPPRRGAAGGGAGRAERRRPPAPRGAPGRAGAAPTTRPS